MIDCEGVGVSLIGLRFNTGGGECCEYWSACDVFDGGGEAEVVCVDLRFYCDLEREWVFKVEAVAVSGSWFDFHEPNFLTVCENRTGDG